MYNLVNNTKAHAFYTLVMSALASTQTIQVFKPPRKRFPVSAFKDWRLHKNDVDKTCSLYQGRHLDEQ